MDQGQMVQRVQALDASAEMEPVLGAVTISLPVDELWELFKHPDAWPRWNRCFYRVRNTSLVEGDRLRWMFHPIRGRYLYKLPSIAEIVEVHPARRVTWHVNALPGFFAQHTYRMEPLGVAETRFGSWEKAMGPSFRAARRFWLAHFKFVLDCSLEGALLLDRIYRREGRLSPEQLPLRRGK